MAEVRLVGFNAVSGLRRWVVSYGVRKRVRAGKTGTEVMINIP